MDSVRNITVRSATAADSKEITEIYNDEILHGVATFDTDAKTEADRLGWLNEHVAPHFVLVAELDEKTDGEADCVVDCVADGVVPKKKVVGYASLSTYRARKAFDCTAELSVYVHKNYRGLGIANALVTETIARAKREKKLHSLVSVITAGNEASIHLHEKFGFINQGTLIDVGNKFGKYLSVIHYQLFL